MNKNSKFKRLHLNARDPHLSHEGQGRITRRFFVALAMAGGVAACTSPAPWPSYTPGHPNTAGLSDTSNSEPDTTLTYYHDIQPIIESRCVECHNPSGIAPFAFQKPSDVTSRSALISSVVSSKTMPPWPPNDSCNSYERDRSLSNDQIDTITRWVAGGAPVGDPSTQVTAQVPTGLSRVDLSLKMPEPFTPNETPDDYRCFLIPWTPMTPQYVTGLGITPGDPHIVHHAVVFVAPPSEVAEYQALDTNQDGPGWTCFGGPGVKELPQWLGAWAPGTTGADFPAGTGILVQPGSQLVLQIHYNTANTPPAPDQTSVAIELESKVTTPAALIPFTDHSWMKGGMPIPAGSPDTTYNYEADITRSASSLSAGVLADNVPLKIYGAGLHMHTRGSQINTRINRQSGTEDCLLDIPAWDFNWQGTYTFSTPTLFNPGDQIYLECHWNNTAANQPYVDGMQVKPTNLNWGETTEEEMCLDLLYLSQ
jgi:hypothetical protein